MSKRHRPERRQPAVEALWRLEIAADQMDTAIALAGLLVPGELAAAATAHADNPPAGLRVGKVAGTLLSADPDAWAEEASTTAAVFRTGDFWDGVVGTLSPQVQLPEQVASAVLGSADAQAAFAGAGFGQQIAALAVTPTAAAALLAAAFDSLPSPDVRGLLVTTSWERATPEAYLAAVSTVASRDDVVAIELGRAVDSLDGPEASAAPAGVLTALLGHAVASGVRDALGQDATATALRKLLDYPDTAVVDQAAAWARSLDLHPYHVECDHDRVAAVIDADDLRGGRFEALSTLRDDLAHRLAHLAANPHADTAARAAHLDLAAHVRPGPARRAALDLAGSPLTDLRTAAARVLAGTPGESGDLPRLDALIDAEPRDDVRRDLTAARHRVRSAGPGEALLALATLLGLDPDPRTFDPAVLIPQANLAERLVHWADLARTRADNDHDPGTFIEAAINLTDQMVDLVLIASDSKTLLKDHEVAALRTNAPGRPDTGTLLGRQRLQQEFQWFPHCLSLRDLRTAHPSKIGSVKPTTLGQDDLVTARTLLRKITAGWAADMHRHLRS